MAHDLNLGASASSDKSTSHAGRLAREWRTAHGWTQHRVSQAVGITPAALSRVENGRHSPTAALWVRLVRVLQVPNPHHAWAAFVQDEPRCARVMALADELLDQGYAEDAAWVVARAEELNQQFFGGRYNGELTRLRGRLAFAGGDYVLAAHHFAQMGQSASKGSRHRRAIAAYDYGLALMHAGRSLEALAELNRAQAWFSAEGDGRGAGRTEWALGTLLLRLGEHRLAQPHYQQAAALLRETPDGPFPQFGWLLCAAALGQLEHQVIRAQLEALAEEAPDSLLPRIHHFIGVVTRSAGRPAEALGWLDRALGALAPGSEQWCDTQCERLLALCLLDEWDAAKALWHELAKHGPSLDDHNFLAWAVMGIGLGVAPNTSGGWLRPRIHHEQRVDAAIRWAWSTRC